MTTRILTDGGRTDTGRQSAFATCDPAAGELPEQALQAIAQDADAAARAANRAYWDHVAEVFGRRCSANWTT